MAEPVICFHCHLEVDQPGRWSARVEQVEQPMCCAGCAAVAQAIDAAGLSDYYRNRGEHAATAALVPEQIAALNIYDDPTLQASFSLNLGDFCRATLAVEELRCGACVWLLEKHLHAQPGVVSVQVNLASERAQLTWDPKVTTLSSLLIEAAQLGYPTRPFDASRREAAIKATGRAYVQRLFIAAIGMLQVMMYALPGYTTDEIEPSMLRLLQWASLVLTLPVLLYSAQPFFQGAWRDLKARRPGMDTPVALGISIAFFSSLYHLKFGGEVYFDSVNMFVFLLLLARYLEWVARRRASRAMDRLAAAAPAQATRIDSDGQRTLVAAVALQVGEQIEIGNADMVPADARLLSAAGAVDQSLLSGESTPVAVHCGAQIPAGAINAGQPMHAEVLRPAAESTLSALTRLVEQGAAEKPQIAQLTDRVAAGFVVALLVLASLVYLLWLYVDPSRALPITLAVLVISCPCALSLATPAALAAASGALLRQGILISRASTLERITQADTVVFDKTGTLTAARPTLIAVQAPPEACRDTLIALAVQLEGQTHHPFAEALRQAAGRSASVALHDHQVHPGGGVSARLDSGARIALGSAQWTGARRQDDADAHSEAYLVEHGVEGCVTRARFVFSDLAYPNAAALIAQLKKRGCAVHLLSGDRPTAVQNMAAQLGIEHFRAQASPEEKVAYIQSLQQRGHKTLMIGDGVNDAPVLACAPAAVAVGYASALTQNAADAIVLGPAIEGIERLLSTASRCRRIIRQNLIWAASYNAISIPAAALGFIPAWGAALGMAASSLLVVGNAMRLWTSTHYSS